MGIHSGACGDRRPHLVDDMKQARALPFWGKGEGSQETERVREPDERGFATLDDHER